MIEWKCLFENRNLPHLCDWQTTDILSIESGFDKEGNYSIILHVTTSLTNRTAICYIEILSNVPSIEFQMPYPINLLTDMEISAKVYNLRSYCIVKWSAENAAGKIKLNEIPGVIDTPHNVSSKDISFLEDLTDVRNIPVTRIYKLVFQKPSKIWRGLEGGLYEVNLHVTCPDKQEIEENKLFEQEPRKFFTIMGLAEIVVPVACNVTLKVFFDNSQALIDDFVFKVDVGESRADNFLIYKYGFVLQGLEVNFHSGISVYQAKTVLPYNGDDGIDTFVEICDYLDRCRRSYGDSVFPQLPAVFPEDKILHTFRQKLIENDVQQVSDYSFMVGHSAGYIKADRKYKDLFKRERMQIVL